MKIIKKIGLVLIGALFLASCAPGLRPPGHGGMPPGQVKKITGAKSAKHYAPGQVKKKNKGKHKGKHKGRKHRQHRQHGW